MKKFHFFLKCCLFILILTIITANDLFSQHCVPAGNWLTVLKGPNGEIRLGMHIEMGEAGMEGFITSPDQSNERFPLDNIKWDNDTLHASCKKMAMTFIATLNAGCDSLAGMWSQGGEKSMTFGRVNVLPVMERPQEPLPPFPYICDEIKFPNKKGKFDLAGTLTYPSEGGPFPALILVTGSGPQNRDEELLGHKPFLVIADYLTRRGFAVLRYDDRGMGASGGDFSKATTLDFATDAEAAFAFLKTHPKINTSRIGLLGHSEGGMIVPVVAAKHKDVAFIILLAGPGTTGKQILISQTELIGRASDMPENELQEDLNVSKNIYEIIVNTKKKEDIITKIRALIKKERENSAGGKGRFAKMTDLEINGLILSVTGDWFMEFVRFDPAPWLKKVRCPVLALNGEKDLQVPCMENLTAIENALKSGKCKNCSVRAFPGLNHLFQHCNTGSPSEYAGISETISEEVLKSIYEWMKSMNGE